MVQNNLTLNLMIRPDQQGSYFNLPFNMPPDTEKLTLSYRYERHREQERQTGSGAFIARTEINIVDLGLIAPDGTQVGSSGSDKTEISVSATSATPGYNPTPLVAGEWQIIVGAYMVAPEGLYVVYELTFTPKHLRLLKGDLHTHTLASDGVLTAQELGQHALRHGLDYLAITDHNQPVTADSLPKIPAITLIPGLEWTHYLGHANFLGAENPYDTPFTANTIEEVTARFTMAQSRGALIVINHPHDEYCGFKFDTNTLPFDCIEIWNGPMREANLQAVDFWHRLLVAGKKIPALGGSDYHRDTPFKILGGPTTCVYAMSSSPADILSALKLGHAYITFAPNGPTLTLAAGDAIMGDTVTWSHDHKDLKIVAENLVRGDIIRVLTGQSSEVLLEAPASGTFRGQYTMQAPGFARIEILRAFLPGLPMLPALLSNPIYFDA